MRLPKNNWKPLSKASDQEKSDITSGILRKHDILRDYKYMPVFDISKTDATEEALVKKLTAEKNKGKMLGKYDLKSIYDSLVDFLEYNSKIGQTGDEDGLQSGPTFSENVNLQSSLTSTGDVNRQSILTFPQILNQNDSLESKIYCLVSNYIEDVLKKDSYAFETTSETLDGDDLRGLAREAVTYVVLDRFQVDNTLFKYNALTKIHWDKDHINDLMMMNKYICKKSEEIVDDLCDALM